MKNSYILMMAMIAIALLGFTSCDLKEYPYGFYSEDNFYKTEADAASAVNYIYDATTYIEFSRTIVFLGDMNTDDMDPKGDAAADTKNLDQWSLNNFTTNVHLANLFKYSYIIINRANAVIKKVPEMTINEDIKNRYLGEAYFMRAYAYFGLARNFGLVPIHLSPVEKLAEATIPPAASLDEMWDVIITDLTIASGLLPYYSVAETGRADKAAADALLAKAYLYIASAKENSVPKYVDMTHNVEDYYQKAAEFASKVVSNPEQSVFGFSDNLLDIYDVEKPNGPEHLFIMSMDRTGNSEGQYSKISKMYIPYVSGAAIYMKQGDTDNLIASHDGWGEYRTNISFYNSFEFGDRRKDWLIVDEVYDAKGESVASYADGKLLYPFCRKFIDPQYVGDKTSTRPYLLRYSDVALIYAEAAGPTAKSYELVNYIRNRAGLGNLPAGLSKEAFRDAVLAERHYELSFEGDRCYDLRRTNKLHTDITEAIEQGLTAEEMVFYPIPSIESDLNPYY